jgi:hypothetical protein
MIRSREVYREIREILAPWCKTHGFKRVRSGLLGWYKPVRDEWCLFWFQCSEWGWNDLTGSEFTVEFLLSAAPVIGPAVKHKRLLQLMDDAPLEQARQIQNRVIASLRLPPKDHPMFRISPQITKWYLSMFQPITPQTMNPNQLWFRYYTVEDIRRWATFILAHLPGALKSFAPDLDL